MASRKSGGMGGVIEPVESTVEGQVSRQGPFTKGEAGPPVKKKSEEARKREMTEAFLGRMRDRFKLIADDTSEQHNRVQALEADKFYNGDQWPDNIAGRMEALGIPKITVNRVKGGVRIITNSLLQDRPSIKVNPVDDQADIRTAQILQGIIRHIEVNSMADVAYDMAVMNQVRHGFGYLRIITEYPDPFSMDQEIRIEPVEDSYAVYLGPCRKQDGSDRDFAFIVKDMAVVQYKAEYGNRSKLAGLNDFTSIGNQFKGWGNKKSIRVVEYYERTWRDAVVVKLEDGRVIEEDKLAPEILDTFAARDEDGEIIKRNTRIPTVTWYECNAVEQLKQTKVPCQFIPLIQVIGDKIMIDGRVYISGALQDAKDPQRQYNYLRSKMTEAIALAPKAPWVMAEGQDENHESEWDRANSEPFSALRYMPVTVAGQPVPPPQRNVQEPPIQGMILAANVYSDDIKATMQVFDAALGATGNETSGRAIESRKAQSGTANYGFANNLIRALRFVGVILLDMIPNVYDARTVLRIIGEDEGIDQAKVIIDPAQPAYQEEENEEGDVTRIYNIGVGRYDVAIGIGPNYLTKRQEAFDMLTRLVNSFPNIMAVAGDIIMRNSDIPGAAEIAKRLKSLLPPELQEGGDGQMPPKIKQAVEQLMAQNEQLTQQLEQALEVIKTKKLELETEIAVAKIKAESEAGRSQSDQIIESMKVASSEHVAAIKAQVESAKIAQKESTEQLLAKFSLLETMVQNVLKPGPVESSTSRV